MSYFNIVRLIFRLFLDGMMACRIAKELATRHILMVTGKEKWSDAHGKEDCKFNCRIGLPKKNRIINFTM